MSIQLIAFPPGCRVRHRRGGTYRVLAIALEEASLRPVVVYRAEYGDRATWTRPRAEFEDGRFAKVDEFEPIGEPEAEHHGHLHR